MVVDDSASLRKVVAGTLARIGYTVVEAVDGSDGLRKARSLGNELALFLVDLNMPGMDGIALIAELRKLPGFNTVPILVLSTETSAKAMRRARDCGATGWIAKPFTFEGLAGTVRRLIG
jgi:two-component system chemotaxis response regulator CheY